MSGMAVVNVLGQEYYAMKMAGPEAYMSLAGLFLGNPEPSPYPLGTMGHGKTEAEIEEMKNNLIILSKKMADTRIKDMIAHVPGIRIRPSGFYAISIESGSICEDVINLPLTQEFMDACRKALETVI